MAEITSIQFLRGTAAAWTAANPTLASGKPGFETDTLKLKMGNGVLAWNDLPYIAGEGSGPESITTSDDEYTITDDNDNQIIHATHATGTNIILPNSVSDQIYFTVIRDTGAGPVVFVVGGTSVLNGLGGVISTETDRTITEVGGWASWVKKGATDWYGTGILGEIASGETGGGGGTWGSIIGTLSDQTDLNTALGLKAPLASPTFTGTVVLPSTTSIGTVSNTEIGYLDGVTSAIQTQFSGKEPTLTRASVVTTGGTITLDMNSVTQRMFVGATSFATAKIIALSSATNALVLNFHFEITNVAATLTFPSGWLMSDANFASLVWTPTTTGKYELGASYDGANWKVKILGPFL